MAAAVEARELQIKQPVGGRMAALGFATACNFLFHVSSCYPSGSQLPAGVTSTINTVMDEQKIVFEPILEKELYTTPPLVDVVVAKINGTSRDIPRAFKLTKEMIGGDMKHLRRIRNCPDNVIECVICRSKATTDQEKEEELMALREKFASDNLFEDFHTAKVPSSAPRTDLQLKACSQIWPCKFAKSIYLNECMEGSIFTETEKFALNIIISELISLIRDSTSFRSGAVVFRCAKIHGIGLSNSEMVCKNPMMHSTMLAIDDVATNSGAGHWKRHKQDLMTNLQDKLDHSEELKDHRIDASFLPYLCTNYDIFLTEEPCFMCAMALVQSRIRRVFYLDTGSMKHNNIEKLCYPDKAIEISYIHRAKNLNHKFEAWRVKLLAEDVID